MTLALPTIIGPELGFADTPLSLIAENLLLSARSNIGPPPSRPLRLQDAVLGLRAKPSTSSRLRRVGGSRSWVQLRSGKAYSRESRCWWESPLSNAARVGSERSVATILIVDDEEPVRDFLAQLWRTWAIARSRPCTALSRSNLWRKSSRTC